MVVKYTQGDLRIIKRRRFMWDKKALDQKDCIEKNDLYKMIADRIKMNNENIQQVLDIAKERKISKRKMRAVIKEFAEENLALYFLLNQFLDPKIRNLVRTKIEIYR